MKTSINIKFIIGIMVGIILSGTVSYVAAQMTINSKDVYYEDNSSLGFNNVQDAIDGTCTRFSNELSNLKNELLESVYPVGSIYISTTLSTPEQVKSTLGGEWETYGAGRTLVGVGNNGTSSYTIGKSGGVESVSTKLTTENLPSHNHVIPELSGTAKEAGDHQHELNGNAISWGPDIGIVHFFTAAGVYVSAASGPTAHVNGLIIQDSSASYTKSTGNHTHSVSTASSTTTTCNECKGTAVSISTIQPYITVYMYRRKA